MPSRAHPSARVIWLVFGGVARALLIGAFAVGVYYSAKREQITISSETGNHIVAHWDLDAAYWSCLTAQVKALVPEGQLTWVSTASPNEPDSYRSLWKVTAGIRPLTARASGVTDLYLVGDPGTREGCFGVRVKARNANGTTQFGTATVPAVDWVLWDASPSRRAP